MSVSTCSAERVLLRESVREMITKESDYWPQSVIERLRCTGRESELFIYSVVL